MAASLTVTTGAERVSESKPSSELETLRNFLSVLCLAVFLYLSFGLRKKKYVEARPH